MIPTEEKEDLEVPDYNMTYEAIIGVEIHIRLKTESGMYCGGINDENEEPNIYTSAISLGHPGTLPRVNKRAIELAIALGSALRCEIATEINFSRKHYFYPDLPKGYQITQGDKPVAEHGYLDIAAEQMDLQRIRIERIHVEEDSAKLKHDSDGTTLADFNRSGAPLAELVTAPDIRSAAAAKAFVQELAAIVRAIDVSNADMSQGQLRVDANVSLRPEGDEAMYPKTEVKNMNSFKSVERAIAYEIERQRALWEDGKAPQVTTTRGWDDKRGITVEQRVKEEAADYRYMPEPDLPVLQIAQEDIDSIREALPELPQQQRDRLRAEYDLSYYDASVLVGDPATVAFFEHTISELRAWLNSLDDEPGSDEEIWDKYRRKVGRLTSNWIQSELFKLVNKSDQSFADIKITPENFAELLTMIFQKRLNSSAAQRVLQVMFTDGGDPSLIAQDLDLEQVTDEGTIESFVDEVIAANPSVVEEYKSGKDKVLKYLVGQVMKASKGKADPAAVTTMLISKIQ